MKLIPEWRRSWRYVTMQLGAMAVVFGLLPPDQQASILAAIGVDPERVPALIGGLFIVGRLVKQKEET